MLFIPEGDDVYRLVSIDPGSSTLGVALFNIDLSNRYCYVEDAFTVNAFQRSQQYPQFIEVYGERAARLHSHQEFLLGLFDNYSPHGVICEAPYMGRFPQAYAALVECVAAVRQAVIRYDCSIPLLTVDPPTAKIAVGVSGRGSNKEDIQKAIRQLPNLTYGERVDVTLLDEHSADAVAVGYYRFKQLMGDI